VIDEASMADVSVTHALLKAVPNRAALLFVAISTNCRPWDPAKFLPM
jgi:hypothetical protein